MFATLKNRWILSISVSVLVSLVISGALSLWISQNEMRETLLEEGQKKLTSKKALVAKSVTTYFENIEKLLLEKSKDPSVIESTQQFNDAFSSYMQQRNPSLSDSKRTVADYYQVNFSNEFNSRNKTQADTSLIINKIEPQAIALQSDYIALNEHPLGNKHLLESKNLANDYDRAHKQYHAYMRRFIEFYGFYDAFIVSAETGSIVYSVFKEVDFATNLVTGPFSNSGIAEAFEKANKLSAGETYLTDFSAYLPSYNSPASFISTPIFDGNQRIGVLILQMPINVINNLLTQNQQWSENGFGDTGEVYLVGEDATLRNESRFYVESPQEYIRLVKESNPTLAEEIELKGTSISLQNVTSLSAKAALAGEQGFKIITDYRGELVLSAYAPIDILGLNWAILAEIDNQEVFLPSATLFSKLLSSTIYLVIGLGIIFVVFSWMMALKLIKPLNEIGAQFIDLNKGDANLSARVRISSISEIGVIGREFNLFIEHIKHVIDEVSMSAETIAAASEELSVTTEQASDSSQIQKERALEVKASVDELNMSISNVSEDTKSLSENMYTTEEKIARNNNRSQQAAADIGALVNDVSESAKTIGELKESVEGINEVVTVINSIAEQTNLLALNAAIEAARAGEHGRGFSVVADEVRTLASRTQVSTVEIQDKIGNLSSVADNAVEAMQRASSSATKGIELVQSVSSSLNEVDKEIKESTAVNEKIANASIAQKANSDDVALNMVGISASAEELSVASNEIQQATQGLSEIASSLQVLVKKFN